MTTNAKDTSGELSRPAPISATSSVDNLQVATKSSIDGVEQTNEGRSREGVAAESIMVQYADSKSNQRNEATVNGPLATTSRSSIISPSGGPLGGPAGSNTTARTHGIPALLLPPQHQTNATQPQTITSSGPLVLTGLVAGSQAPEFLYQLTKMLTDDNRDTIEWCNGKIEVHSPQRLESDVLHKYFRHSKFASFQRQLNYFGFRKQAGKGKMAPCSYVNEDLPSNDLTCLLNIKRKTSVSTAAKEKEKQSKKKELKMTLQSHEQTASSVNPVLAGILHRSSMASTAEAKLYSSETTTNESQSEATQSHHAVAQAAVGRGIRHGVGRSQVQVSTRSGLLSQTVPVDVPSSEPEVKPAATVANPLSQLATNFQNSLNDLVSVDAVPQEPAVSTTTISDQALFPGGFLRRDDSLVDLAMIPVVENSEVPGELLQVGTNKEEATEDVGLCFIDFPNPDIFPLGPKPT